MRLRALQNLVFKFTHGLSKQAADVSHFSHKGICRLCRHSLHCSAKSTISIMNVRRRMKPFCRTCFCGFSTTMEMHLTVLCWTCCASLQNSMEFQPKCAALGLCLCWSHCKIDRALKCSAKAAGLSLLCSNQTSWQQLKQAIKKTCQAYLKATVSPTHLLCCKVSAGQSTHKLQGRLESGAVHNGVSKVKLPLKSCLKRQGGHLEGSQ